MTKDERQQSLIAARLACEWLDKYVKQGERNSAYRVDEPLRSNLQSLLVEFKRLDEKEQKQIRAGKRYGKLGAEHGRKGGRPKKTNNGGEK